MIFLAAGCSDGDPNPMGSRPVCAAPEALNLQVQVPGGDYVLGDTRFHAEERPEVTASVNAFEIDAYEVTNQQFAEFVDATGYRTRAERGLPEAAFDTVPDEMRSPGSAVFSPPLEDGPGWWRFVDGANWRSPEGPGSSIKGKEMHPVVHVALEDAFAYANWRGRRLPTEAEWEAAARGGRRAAPYAWGNEKPDALAQFPANTWQGIFPIIDQARDGYAGLAPVGCFAPNGFGAHDMTGNVWEWTTDRYQSRRSETVETLDVASSKEVNARAAIKGGSYLCAPNYCARYRPAARQPQEVSLGASHIGFRTVSAGK
ncbi:MAG: formylglycine-generating enzyme family protein [Pseudomonadota bacterium]